MRAARSAPHWPRPARQTGESAAAQPKSGYRIPATVVGFALAGLFLAGYITGLLICRSDLPNAGKVLAGYYMDKQNFSTFGRTFSAMFSATFLQASLILLCGTSLAGIPLAAIAFCAKGTAMGLCAASIYSVQGTRGLVIYWLLSCLHDMAVLLLLVWLAQAAAVLSAAMLRAVWSGNSIRGALKIKAKTLIFRYVAVILVGAVCAFLGAGSAVLFAGVLL